MIFCTNASCHQTAILKGRTVYQCWDETCFQRICSSCHAARPRLDKNLWNTLKETFVPITKTSADPAKDRFGSTFTAHVQKLPTLVSPSDNNQSLADTIKNLTSKGLDHKPFDCNLPKKIPTCLLNLADYPKSFQSLY